MQEPLNHELAFYASVPTACSYLPERTAVTVFVDPFARMNTARYSFLVEHGFRRSGNHVYSPYCPQCSSCVPSRIPVNEFQPSRTQRRTWRMNADLHMTEVQAKFYDEHYRLYQRYVSQRHPGSGMEQYGPDQYISFLSCDWGNSSLLEFRLGDMLVAVASIDHLSQGLSAVYTFFDPDMNSRGLGTYAVLRQIDLARKLGLPHVYLGYWISECKAMRYKAAFQPLEILHDNKWQLFSVVP